LTDARGRIDPAQIDRLADQVAALRRRGIEVVLVSSGAIASGMGIMKMRKRPKLIKELQACAAIGQPPLMATYERAFARHRMHVAQILITYFDLDSRQLHENARHTIEHLLKLGCVPIINENDVVSFEEIKFGDNDQLSAHMALLIHASRLIILSTIEGLARNSDGTGKIIPLVSKIDRRIESLAGTTKSQTSVGGMVSKIKAAKLATGRGITVHIANGRRLDVLISIGRGDPVGTLFKP
jgi:glutamate 5-kinase